MDNNSAPKNNPASFTAVHVYLVKNQHDLLARLRKHRSFHGLCSTSQRVPRIQHLQNYVRRLYHLSTALRFGCVNCSLQLLFFPHEQYKNKKKRASNRAIYTRRAKKIVTCFLVGVEIAQGHPHTATSFTGGGGGGGERRGAMLWRNSRGTSSWPTETQTSVYAKMPLTSKTIHGRLTKLKWSNRDMDNVLRFAC